MADNDDRKIPDMEIIKTVRMWYESGLIDKEQAIRDLNGFENLLDHEYHELEEASKAIEGSTQTETNSYVNTEDKACDTSEHSKANFLSKMSHLMHLKSKNRSISSDQDLEVDEHGHKHKSHHKPHHQKHSIGKHKSESLAEASHSIDESGENQTEGPHLLKSNYPDKETIEDVLMWFRLGMMDRKTAILQLNGHEELINNL